MSRLKMYQTCHRIDIRTFGPICCRAYGPYGLLHALAHPLPMRSFPARGEGRTGVEAGAWVIEERGGKQPFTRATPGCCKDAALRR
jgi:hypothetical protein